ncbi:MAG: zf-HC2 domain-containing protein, partial [Acidimicrobiales bacterium]
MGRDVNHADAATFLGAYALDALDPDERDAVERHVRGCGACLAEVAEHREVAALLAPGWVAAPDGVWDRIAGALEETPPPLAMPPAPVVTMPRSGEGAAGAAPPLTP